LFSAVGSDADNDPLEYIWTENDPDLTNVVLTASDGTAQLTINPNVGGAARTFSVGVAVVDLYPDLITPRHPPIPVTNLQIDGVGNTTVTATTDLAIGESVMLYSIALAPPTALTFGSSVGLSANITNIVLANDVLTVTANNAFGSGQNVEFQGLSHFTYLNGQAVTIQTAIPTAFTANFTHTDDSFADTGFALYPPALTYYVKVTYINSVGETLSSAEFTTTTSPGYWPVVNSPAASGNATAYNVYIGLSSGLEKLQNSTPVSLGTDFTLAALNNTVSPPTSNTAFIEDVNDQVFALTFWSAPSFTAITPNIPAALPSTTVTGWLIVQYQFATALVTVPMNVAPSITFPFVPWGSPPSVTVDRNTQIMITDGTITDPTTQFPIVITGVNQPDDAPFYQWQQLSGTPVTFSYVGPVLTLDTNGVSVFGESLVFQFTLGDGVSPTVSATCTINVVPYSFTELDTMRICRSVWSGNISQRNTPLAWGQLDVSAFYNNFRTVKRTSVADGSDRYIVISPGSVLVYGGITPNIALLRRLFTPEGTSIVDAVHTEDDYTLVIDDSNNLFRYSTAPLINTDNPDTTIDLTTLSLMVFNKIFSTYAHDNVRVLALSGSDGCLIVQVTSDALLVQGITEITTAADLLVGADNVQFVRLSNVETIHSGKILIGTVARTQAAITSVSIVNNALTVACTNPFSVGDIVTFSGLTGAAAFLNGLTAAVVTTSIGNFVASLEHINLSLTSTGGTAIAINDGTTYESLVDLSHGQIIGTWNAAKLKNQYVQTGEILFEPDSTYSGRPLAPVMNTPTVINFQVTLSWTQERSDLIYQYIIDQASQLTIPTLIGASLSYSTPTNFGQDLGVVDVSAVAAISFIAVASDVLTVTCTNNYSSGDVVTLSGVVNATFLNGQTVTIVTASSSQFTATFSHADYPSTADFGLVTKNINAPLVAVSSSPGPGQYSVASNGLYTFNPAQENNNMLITFRSNFSVLQIINSGAVQKITVSLSSGSYVFRMQSVSLDGTSNYSNLVTISF
jgi:hypothetical protein